MGKKEKLIKRLLSEPNDFTFEEAEVLLGYFLFFRTNKGKTSGSRVSFFNVESRDKLNMHKPHPGNMLKKYQVRSLIVFLKEGGYL